MRLFFLILSVLIISCSKKKSKEHHENMDQLDWLLGTWAILTPEHRLYETWEKLNDSVYAGSSVIIINSDTAYTEKISLLKKNDELFYVPTVSNQNDGKPVEFKLKSTEHGIYVFENTEHDFPQRIIYDNPHPDSLHASIEGYDKGEFRREEFKMVRQ